MTVQEARERLAKVKEMLWDIEMDDFGYTRQHDRRMELEYERIELAKIIKEAE